MTAPRVFFHVQNLLGSGHLARAAILARALAEAGFEVDLVSGGMPVANIPTGTARLIQLPPMRATDSSFATLVDAGGDPIDDAWRAHRRERLLELWAKARPQVLVTELFPFGRRALEFELLPLLEAAKAQNPRPLILCSLRDVLTRKPDPRKRQAMAERVRAYYDRVLVHGDPGLIALDASFPEAPAIADLLAYTGYVGAPAGPEPPPGDGEDEVIVSAGGGAVGERLLETALAARPLSQQGDCRWRLLAGGRHDSDRLAQLQKAAGGDGEKVVIEPARTDFTGLLARCRVSVSQAGYNTVMDLLGARARAVLVPFAAGAETEQSDRAAALAAAGWAQLVGEATLDPPGLAQAIDRAAAAPRPATGDLRRDGAGETVRLIGEWLG